MANYCCALRTNYFHVKDPDAFTELMKTVVSEDAVDVWEKEDHDGGKTFGFGCYGQIYGCHYNRNPNNTDMDNYDDDNYDYDRFVKELMKLVEDDDAIIIFESGNEKLRYVTGQATIITSKEWDIVDLCDFAVDTASKLLGNRSYSTVCAY